MAFELRRERTLRVDLGGPKGKLFQAGRAANAKAPEAIMSSPGLRNSEKVGVATEKKGVEFWEKKLQR